MYGEVSATLAVLPRAVERINDPDALSGHPSDVVGTLLREHDVVRTSIDEESIDEQVCLAIRGIAQELGAVAVIILDLPKRSAHVEEQGAGLTSHVAGKLGVGNRVRIDLGCHVLYLFWARSRPSAMSSSTASAASEMRSGSSLRSVEDQGLST